MDIDSDWRGEAPFLPDCATKYLNTGSLEQTEFLKFDLVAFSCGACCRDQWGQMFTGMRQQRKHRGFGVPVEKEVPTHGLDLNEDTVCKDLGLQDIHHRGSAVRQAKKAKIAV